MRISATALYKSGGTSWFISTILKIALATGGFSMTGMSCSCAISLIFWQKALYLWLKA